MLTILCAVLGVAAVLYPVVASWHNQHAQAAVAETQDAAVAATSQEDLSQELSDAEDYNARLLAGRVVVTDPFDPKNATPSDEEYQSILNLNGDGVMAELIIPSIGVDLPVYHGVSGGGMDHGVGHMPSSSLPVGGPSTHAVLAGHTGLPSAIIFDRLDQMQTGDWFVIRVLGEVHAYRVTSTEVVLPDESQSLAIQDGKDLVTLVTCTPYGVNTHRLLVHAERSEVPDEWWQLQDQEDMRSAVTGEAQRLDITTIVALAGIGIACGLVILLVVLAFRRRKERREEASSYHPRHFS